MPADAVDDFTSLANFKKSIMRAYITAHPVFSLSTLSVSAESNGSLPPGL